MLSQEEIRRQEYTARINRVIDYIDAHLDEPLGLEALAAEACFSRFHFHRVFAAMVGETLAGYVRRLRLERAAMRIRANPKETLTEIALACGFSSPSVFARAFRERFGLSASQWRRRGNPRKAERNAGQAISSPGEAPGAFPPYPEEHHDSSRRKRMQQKEKLSYTVEVKDLPALTVAYVRHVGRFQDISRAFERLMRWAGPRGLAGFPGTKILAVYHDSPDVTQTDKLRSDACITVPEGTRVEGEVGLLTVPGGKFAVAHFEIAPDRFGEAWNALMGEWLPSSGWQPDDRMCYEVYLNEPSRHPEGKFVVDICEPVRPL
jgi:AraC family transcriptional regulator